MADHRVRCGIIVAELANTSLPTTYQLTDFNFIESSCSHCLISISLSMTFISLVTSCVGLQGEEPQTALFRVI